MRGRSGQEIAAALRAADGMLRAGRSIPQVLTELRVSETTYRRWRRRFDHLRPDEVARVRELERENARLRRIVADSALQIEALREVSRGGW